MIISVVSSGGSGDVVHGGCHCHDGCHFHCWSLLVVVFVLVVGVLVIDVFILVVVVVVVVVKSFEK